MLKGDQFQQLDDLFNQALDLTGTQLVALPHKLASRCSVSTNIIDNSTLVMPFNIPLTLSVL